MLRPSLLPPVRRAACAVALVMLAVLVSACGSSGRQLRAPAPDAVSPTRSSTPRSGSTTTTTKAVGTLAPTSALTLSSAAFASGSELPAVYTCDGPTPPLQWSGVPVGTEQLVLAAVDRDVPESVRWLVTGMAPTDGSILAGTNPPTATALTNSLGRNGWTAPCAVAGVTQHVEFVVLALPAPITIPASTPALDALAQMRQAAGGNEAALAATVTGR